MISLIRCLINLLFLKTSHSKAVTWISKNFLRSWMNPSKAYKNPQTRQSSPRASKLSVLARNPFVRKITVLVISWESNVDPDVYVLAAETKNSSQGVLKLLLVMFRSFQELPLHFDLILYNHISLKKFFEFFSARICILWSIIDLTIKLLLFEKPIMDKLDFIPLYLFDHLRLFPFIYNLLFLYKRIFILRIIVK